MRRGRLSRRTGAHLHFWCTQGKSRQGGIRRPFAWAVPRFLRKATDTLGPLDQFYSLLKDRNPSANFLIPDLNLCKVDGRYELTYKATWNFTKPMPQGKLLELMRGMLVRAGVPYEGVLPMSYNTLRRFMPTLGEAAGFDLTALQSLSNWADLPKATAQSPAPSCRSALPTSLTYAADKVLSAAYNRHKAVIYAHLSSSLVEEKRGTDGLYPADALPWDIVRGARGHLDSAESLATSGPPWAMDAHTRDQSSKQSQERIDAKIIELGEVKAGDDTSSSSGSATSSEAEDDRDSDEDDKDIDFPNAFKIATKGRYHLQHFLLESGIVAYCRGAPFREPPEAVDEDDVLKNSWNICRNCLRALPPLLRRRVKP